MKKNGQTSTHTQSIDPDDLFFLQTFDFCHNTHVGFCKWTVPSWWKRKYFWINPHPERLVKRLFCFLTNCSFVIVIDLWLAFSESLFKIHKVIIHILCFHCLILIYFQVEFVSAPSIHDNLKTVKLSNNDKMTVPTNTTDYHFSLSNK